MKKVFLLLMVLGSTLLHAKIVPADGLWRTTDDPQFGSGLMLTTEGDVTLVSVFTYDDAGNNAWYVATGQVNEEGLFSTDLFQTEQGTYLLNENPPSAQVLTSESTLNIQFSGSQVATLSIDDSESKTIWADHFGFASSYKIPDLTGSWVVGDAVSGDSFILDLTLLAPVVFGGVSLPYHDVVYTSSHPSTENWQLQCFIIIGVDFNNSQCDLVREPGFGNLKVNNFDIGNQRMTLYNDDTENPERYQAFRLNKDRRLLPSDGHWRTYDDPAVGSGVVMRTQNDVTVVVVYSYDDTGNSEWKIASGQFDENGRFNSTLFKTNGGTAIESITPMTASLQDMGQSIEILLLGFELATISINESEPKTIHNYNFGVENFSTNHFLTDNEPYNYPDQEGSWVMVSHDFSQSRVVDLSYFDLNLIISPPAPPLFGARTYETDRSNTDFSFEFTCKKILSYGALQFDVVPYCTGRLFQRPDMADVKVYFQDIGVGFFRVYLGDIDNIYYNYEEIDRTANYYDFYRLSY